MKDTLLAAGAVIAALAFGPQAQASLVQFGFSGAGVSGSGFLSVTPDTVVGDPIGAYTITNVTGTFSDSNMVSPTRRSPDWCRSTPSIPPSVRRLR